jgi:glycosyltransferase 2 family protein
MNLIQQLDKRAVVAGGLTLVALGVVVTTPELLGDRIGDALAGLSAASPGWLWLAGTAFLAFIVCTGCAWRAGVAACGGGISMADASARYAVGSLVNAVAPAGMGAAARIALFSRTLPGRDRLLTATSIAGAIGVARAPALALLVLAAAVIAGFPLWPVALLAGAAAAAMLVAFLARRRLPHARLAHLLDGFRALGRSPRTAATLLGWVSLAMVARISAAGAIAAALGVENPLRAAVIMVPALALAGAVPLTPGSIGIGSGAIAVGLHLVGVDGGTAIATGIAFQAVESAVSLLAGSSALLYLARLPTWTVRLAGAAACLALAGGFSATMLIQL